MVLRSWGQGTKSYKGVELSPVVSCTKIRTREANNDLYQPVQNIDIMGSWDYELIFVLVRFYLAIIFKIFHIPQNSGNKKSENKNNHLIIV